jgi:hypothetical protein
VDLLTGDTPFGLATNFKIFKSGEPGAGEVKVYASSNAGRRSGAMKRALITKNTHLIDSWKVLAPKPQARLRIYAYSIDDKAHKGLLKVGRDSARCKKTYRGAGEDCCH